mgnify:CR=1 FL=1
MLDIGPFVILPEPLQMKVVRAIQGGGVARVSSAELLSTILWSRTFEPGQICAITQEVNMKQCKGLKIVYSKNLLYPVIVGQSAAGEVTFEIAYSFGIADALEIMCRGGSVKRKSWHHGFDVRWIHDDNRAMIWYNTGDGYLPYLISQEDCVATDWGVVVGFDKDRHIG